MGISSDLQRAIVARLKAAVPSVQGRVFDNPPENNAMPYISIGPSYWTDDSVVCIRARVETVQVDVWASNRPSKQTCKDAADEVAEALVGWASDAIAMHPFSLGRPVQEIDDPAPGVVHGIVQVEAMVEG